MVNLAAKLCITNPKQTKVLCQYVLNLAKYDQNYDIRDRARFLRQLVLPEEVCCVSPPYKHYTVFISCREQHFLSMLRRSCWLQSLHQF